MVICLGFFIKLLVDRKKPNMWLGPQAIFEGVLGFVVCVCGFYLGFLFGLFFF